MSTLDLVKISVLEITFDFPGFSNIEIGVTSDGNTVVCHHPAVDIPYEFTQVRVLVPIYLPFRDKNHNKGMCL